MHEPNAFPDFLGIGVQKAGTTWLDKNLRAHPEIWLPKEKELHYFDESIEDWQRLRTKLFGTRMADRRWRRQLRSQLRAWRDNRSLEDLRWNIRYFLRQPSDAWYASLFAAGRGKLTGDISPGYALLTPARIAHVRRLMPEARIILFLRNPIERPWSQLLMELGRRGRVRGLRMRRAHSHFLSDASRSRTEYVRIMDRWRSFFPDDQIFVGFLEDVHFRPEELLAEVCRFLGLEETASWPDAKRRVYSTATTDTIPATLARELAIIYDQLLDELDRRFGGHAAWWRYAGERIRNGAGVDAELPYPLYESHLWREWTSAQGLGERPPLQSGVLAEISGAVETR